MLQNLLNLLLNHTPLLYWTQSLWRDEAFSVWIAQGSFADVISRTAHDFNPPLYYLLLHYWMIIFGKSEVALRGMSIVFFLITLIIVYYFAVKLFKNNKIFINLTVALAAFNPMLIYYAFELRMYSLLVLLSTASMYFLITRNWVWYVISTILGMYTQPFMALVILSQIPYYFFSKQLNKMIRVFIALFVLYLPWIPTLLNQFKQSGPMWMFPIDVNLVLSVLGNLFTGYEGTPGNLYILMYAVSFVIIVSSVFVFKHLKKYFWLFLSWIYLPLILVLVISIVKPIYVNRYLIFVCSGEIFILSLAIFSLKNLKLKYYLLATSIIFSIGLNFIAVNFHRKVNLKQTFKQINQVLQNNDLVLAQTPLVFYESLYYSNYPNNVRLYNPYSITPPKYVGSDGMPQSVWVSGFSKFPLKSFFIQEDGQYKIVSAR